MSNKDLSKTQEMLIHQFIDNFDVSIFNTANLKGDKVINFKLNEYNIYVKITHSGCYVNVKHKSKTVIDSPATNNAWVTRLISDSISQHASRNKLDFPPGTKQVFPWWENRRNLP